MKRIYLREIAPSDVTDNYHRWMHDPEVTAYLESRFFPNSKEKLVEYVVEKQGDRNYAFLAIVLKETERHIGNIKLGPINWNHRHGDVGILIGEKDCWGKGYGTEAIQLIIEYANKNLGLHKLTAGCYAPNTGSAKAFLTAGFEKVGTRHAHFLSDGKYVDEYLFEIILS